MAVSKTRRRTRGIKGPHAEGGADAQTSRILRDAHRSRAPGADPGTAAALHRLALQVLVHRFHGVRPTHPSDLVKGERK